MTGISSARRLRAQERLLNQFAQFPTIDALNIRFIHQRSPSRRIC